MSKLGGSRGLVTGGLGFIGSHLVQALLRQGWTVTIYDNFDDFYSGKEENLEAIKATGEEFRVEQGDILDYTKLSQVVKGNDVVFHLAAQAGIRYCNRYPLKANSVNIEGTLNALMASREQGIQKLVYASSSSIFGNPLYMPIDENHPTVPNSPYGVSKLAAEQYVKVFGKVYGMSACCLRYFSVYGPRGRPDQVIYAFADRASKGTSPEIFGSGEQTRDFTFVSDIVDATILAMEKDESSGEVFNIGHGSRITVNELARKVISGLGKDLEPIYREESKGDFSDTQADNAKARKLLGWDPKVSLDDGLQQFLEWFAAKYR